MTTTDYAKMADGIADTIKHCSTPLDEFQLMAMAGALAVYVEKEKEALENNLATAQTLLMEVVVAGEEREFDDVTQYVMPIETYQAVSDFALDQSNTEEVRTELTKREASARKEGFEEGQKAAVDALESLYMASADVQLKQMKAAKQAGRDEYQNELSEQEPSCYWYSLENRYFSAVDAAKYFDAREIKLTTPLYTRPLPPVTKE